MLDMSYLDGSKHIVEVTCTEGFTTKGFGRWCWRIGFRDGFPPLYVVDVLQPRLWAKAGHRCYYYYGPHLVPTFNDPMPVEPDWLLGKWMEVKLKHMTHPHMHPVHNRRVGDVKPSEVRHYLTPSFVDFVDMPKDKPNEG